MVVVHSASEPKQCSVRVALSRAILSVDVFLLIFLLSACVSSSSHSQYSSPGVQLSLQSEVRELVPEDKVRRCSRWRHSHNRLDKWNSLFIDRELVPLGCLYRSFTHTDIVLLSRESKSAKYFLLLNDHDGSDICSSGLDHDLKMVADTGLVTAEVSRAYLAYNCGRLDAAIALLYRSLDGGATYVEPLLAALLGSRIKPPSDAD